MKYGLLALLCFFSPSLAFSNCVPGLVSQHSGQFKSYKTGYFPEDSAMQGGFLDRAGRPLQTFQTYLRGKAPYVSVAMDHTDSRFPYGTMLRIPQLEKVFGRCILFRVVDTGSAFEGKGASKIDLCNEDREGAMSAPMQGWTDIFIVPQGLN